MTSPVFVRPASRTARAEAGRARREAVPLEAHAELGAAGGSGRDPLAVLRAQDADRLPWLVPIRWGRMSVSPFTFYRGAAALMAADLAALPRTDLEVQLCGDAHLSNFGIFAAPDRRLVFDLNDFDETLPGPFEWDVKRLAASLVVAGRDNGIAEDRCVDITTAAVRRYRTTMALAAAMDPLDVWYHRIEFDDLAEQVRTRSKSTAKQMRSASAKASRKSRLGALSKLTEVVDGRRRIVDRPPLIRRFTDDELGAELDRLRAFHDRYVETLQTDRRVLFGRYAPTDIALKVVGVGSVGTRCLVSLYEAGDGEPLFLQLKEATASVLEPHLRPSTAPHAGQRVVEGQRLMQSATDTFLGWSRYDAPNGPQDYYVRQLWDGKASMTIEDMGASMLTRYAELCAAVLARAHARTGDAAVIAGYLGDDDTFDRAVAAFAVADADRTAADHASVTAAIADGELEVVNDL